MNDLDRLQRDFRDARDKLERGAARLVKTSTLATQALGQARAPVLTGLLKSSISSDFDLRGPVKRGETGPDTSYDIYVHGGTRHMAPRPFMFQAADVVEPRFYAAAETLAVNVLVGRRG